MPCRFSEQGCEKKLTKSVKEDHEKNCPHHLVQCLVFNCKEKVSLSDYREHCNGKNHGCPILVQFGDQIPENVIPFITILNANRCTGIYGRVHFYHGREDLLFSTQIVRYRNKFFLWIYVSGTQEEAEEFTCEIVHCYDDGKHPGFLVTRSTDTLPVVSNKRLFWDVIERGPVLSYSEKFVDENLRDGYRWRICTRLLSKNKSDI